jgi:hypothetical protein
MRWKMFNKAQPKTHEGAAAATDLTLEEQLRRSVLACLCGRTSSTSKVWRLPTGSSRLPRRLLPRQSLRSPSRPGPTSSCGMRRSCC